MKDKRRKRIKHLPLAQLDDRFVDVVSLEANAHHGGVYVCAIAVAEDYFAILVGRGDSAVTLSPV